MRRAVASDTIYALSSGRLPAGIAVIRISGPSAFPTVAALTGRLLKPRQAELVSIRSRSGDLLDRGLVLLFPGPRSFTGDDCAELHLHGGHAVVAAVSREISEMPGLRAAEAGEFSLRAFQNGKFDLTTAEALGDLIEAETEAQRRFAIGNTSGRNASLYGRWRETLLTGRAMIEAELDFPEENDVPGAVSDQVWDQVKALVVEIDNHLNDFHRSEIIRDGYRVAIVGAPNAGKSSLLNAVARREVAIVSDEPGTTRDLIEVSLDLKGLKVILTDTAGIRENAGAVEREGIARARDATQRADLILLIMDSVDPTEIDDLPPSVPVLRVRSKIDLQRPDDSRETSRDVGVSVLTGHGIGDLVEQIASRVAVAAGATSDLLPFRERHVVELTSARLSLREFLMMRDAPLELAAEQLRKASDHLSRIVGAIDIEDLLDIVFSRFCVTHVKQYGTNSAIGDFAWQRTM